MGDLSREIIHSILNNNMTEASQVVGKEFSIFIDSDINSIVDELNSAGVSVNLDKLHEHIAEYKAKEAKSAKDFSDSVKSAGFTDLNLNKRADILKWFFDILKVPVYKAGKTGPSLDSESLEYMSKYTISAQQYLDAKQSHSMVTMLENIEKAVKDGKIYPHHNLNKAASGRFSSSGADGDKLNINGWPKSIRDILMSSPASEIVSFDYVNMEGAVSASMAKENSIADAIYDGEDLHQKLADILGVPRSIAKMINHGVSYGMTAFGLARKIGCTEEEAQEFIDKYWKSRPNIHNLKQDVIHMARIYGEVETISGFKRSTSQLSDDQIWSTFIQGSAADLFKEALVKVQKYLSQSGRGSVKTPMHDALICDLSQDNLDETIKNIVEIMEHIHPKFKLRVDVQVGKW